MKRASRGRAGAVAFAAVAVGLVVLLGPIGAAVAPAQEPAELLLPKSLYDPRLDDVRRASVSWDLRRGPKRVVIDQVCLVPDVPTFLEAIATWDETHWFPILIEDVEYTLKFVRAFRPARVVRFPRKAPAVGKERVWEAAVAAVERSWMGEADEARRIPGAQVLRQLRTTPPGVVLSAPESPMLAGAVALAAGRFQPLLRWQPGTSAADVPSLPEAERLVRDLEGVIAAGVRHDRQLGDACDFITLAGDWPFRYRGGEGENAFDDLIGRGGDPRRRWAFTGRLTGTAVPSVYRAMCGLFLQPPSALLFNGYATEGLPWVAFDMRPAARRLQDLLPIRLVSGTSPGTVTAWHQVFDPTNRFGLVMVNSSGSPTAFVLPSGLGQTADIPRSVPSVVLQVHSFSAANPDDPDTLAGRWLLNGAYAYFGAINEPMLQAFRTPGLIGALIAENLPLGVVVRQSAAETEIFGPPWNERFSRPWRLVYLGDPLVRLDPKGTTPGRLREWPPTASWPAVRRDPPPPGSGDDATRLHFARDWALAAQAGGRDDPRDEHAWLGLLGQVARERLLAADRAVYDDLLVDTLYQLGQTSELRRRLRAIPAPERPARTRRWLETLTVLALQDAIAHDAFPEVCVLWKELILSDSGQELKTIATARAAALADPPARWAPWIDQLRGAIREVGPGPTADLLGEELKRVEKKRETAPRTSFRSGSGAATATAGAVPRRPTRPRVGPRGAGG